MVAINFWMVVDEYSFFCRVGLLPIGEAHGAAGEKTP